MNAERLHALHQWLAQSSRRGVSGSLEQLPQAITKDGQPIELELIERAERLVRCVRTPHVTKHARAFMLEVAAGMLLRAAVHLRRGEP